MALVTICQKVQTAFNNFDGSMLADALAMGDIPLGVRNKLLQTATLQSLQLAVRQCQLPTRYDQILVQTLLGHQAELRNQMVAAHECQIAAARLFLDQISDEQETNWWLRAVQYTIVRLRLLSYKADEQAQSMKKEYTEKSILELRRFFQKMVIARDKIQQSKKMGCLFVAVNMMQMYFRINNLRLSINTKKSIESPNVGRLTQFPLSQQVAYKYYVGRISVLEEKYQEAEEALTFAFSRCTSRAFENKRRALQFLVPVKLLLGKLPKVELLRKYRLEQFQGITDAIKTGNMRAFLAALETHQEYFIRKGIYLILEKLKTFVFRSLFKRTFKVVRSVQGDDVNKVKLETLLKAVHINGMEMDMDELECVLANLIFKGYMKGYIAHARSLVLSRATPFPSLQQALQTGGL